MSCWGFCPRCGVHEGAGFYCSGVICLGDFIQGIFFRSRVPPDLFSADTFVVVVVFFCWPHAERTDRRTDTRAARTNNERLFPGNEDGRYQSV